MADSEVTLLLGEQMAIIYLGVNIAIPLVFSAILSALVLLIVQSSRFIKRRMGRSNSKVVTLTPHISETSMAPPEINRSKVENKDDPLITGQGFIRKRRSSIVTESLSLPSVSSEGSFTSRDRILPSSSSPSSRQSSAKSRTRRISSSNRVSPMTPPELTQTSVSEAWTEGFAVTQDTVRNNRSRNKRKDSDRVVSPSQINDLSEDTETTRNHSVFADDMSAMEIW